jgi:hypothetical protein
MKVYLTAVTAAILAAAVLISACMMKSATALHMFS